MNYWWLWIVGIVTTGLFFAPAIWLWWGRRRDLGRIRALLNAEVLHTSLPLRAGPIQVQGCCRPIENVIAPVSQSPCIGYTLRVATFVPDTDGGNDWDLAFVHQLAPFVLVLSSEELSVACAQSLLWLAGKPSAIQEMPWAALSSNLKKDILAQARERLANKRPDVIPSGYQKIRVVEHLLRPGDTAFVLGSFQPASSAQGMHPTAQIGSRPNLPLLVVNATKEELLSMLGTNAPNPQSIELLTDAMLDRLPLCHGNKMIASRMLDE